METYQPLYRLRSSLYYYAFGPLASLGLIFIAALMGPIRTFEAFFLWSFLPCCGYFVWACIMFAGRNSSEIESTDLFLALVTMVALIITICLLFIYSLMIAYRYYQDGLGTAAIFVIAICAYGGGTALLFKLLEKVKM